MQNWSPLLDENNLDNGKAQTVSVIITTLWTLEIASNCRKLEVHENGNVECFALHEMQSIPVGSRRYFWRQWFVQLSVFGLLV